MWSCSYGDTMPDALIAQRLSSLHTSNRTALRDLWRQLFERAPPPRSNKICCFESLDIAYRSRNSAHLAMLAAADFASLQLPSRRIPTWQYQLDQLIKPGTRLVRQWKEQVYVVNVEAKSYEYKGVHYKNLSEIARLITGTRWSGPLFFGVKLINPISRWRSDEC